MIEAEKSDGKISYQLSGVDCDAQIYIALYCNDRLVSAKQGELQGSFECELEGEYTIKVFNWDGMEPLDLVMHKDI